MSPFKIFVGLESTVLRDWDSGMLVNASLVRDFLIQQKTHSISVFSFAVIDDSDRQYFDAHHRTILSRALDVVIKQVITVNEMMVADQELTQVGFNSPGEFVVMRSKVCAFASWTRLHEAGNCMLIDASVINADILDRDSGFITRFSNVKDLDK